MEDVVNKKFIDVNRSSLPGKKDDVALTTQTQSKEFPATHLDVPSTQGRNKQSVKKAATTKFPSSTALFNVDHDISLARSLALRINLSCRLLPQRMPNK